LTAFAVLSVGDHFAKSAAELAECAVVDEVG
jgi:hypothetical protein